MENDLKKTSCKRCGRKLKTKESIELGMGPTCWKRFIQENNHKKLFEVKDAEVKDDC